MRFRIFILILFLYSGYSSTSQSLYELKYHFQLKDGREDYKAMLLRNEDGTGIIRLEYYDLNTKSRNLVDMDMIEKYGIDEEGREDTTILIYVGLDQNMVMGKVLYKPDNFVFTLNPATHFYEPAFVISINDNGTEDMGVLDDVRLLQQEDLTIDFVLQYFTEKDEFYINLFDEAETRGLNNKEKESQLHLVLVANTEDKSIGSSCVIDKDATYKTFSEVAEYLGIQFKPTVIAGKDFSKKNVDKALNALNPNSKDIVVFYYSGHGFNEQNTNYSYPFLDLRDKSFQNFGGEYTINMETIFDNIKSKGARLNLVFSDCCNSDPTKTTNISTDGATTRTSSIGWNMNNCKALFMSEKPFSLLMTAAAKGELSAGNSNKGGIFTFNFRESLEKFLSPFSNDVTWTGLVISAKNQTVYNAKRTGCRQEDNSLKSCIQNPMFKMD